MNYRLWRPGENEAGAANRRSVRESGTSRQHRAACLPNWSPLAPLASGASRLSPPGCSPCPPAFASPVSPRARVFRPSVRRSRRAPVRAPSLRRASLLAGVVFSLCCSLYGLTSPWSSMARPCSRCSPCTSPTAAPMQCCGDGRGDRQGSQQRRRRRHPETRQDHDAGRLVRRLESFIGRADTLAKLQTLWGDAKVANQIPGWIDAVTSEDIQRTARTYLTKANRTVIDRKPAPAAAAATATPPKGDKK